MSNAMFAAIAERWRDLPPVERVERIATPIGDFLAEVASRGAPVILTSPRYGRAVDEATLASVFERFAGVPMRVRVGDYATPEGYRPERRRYETVTLAEYTRVMAETPADGVPPYAGNQPLPGELIEALGLRPPPFYPAASFERPSAWIGAKGSLTPLHRDGADNFAFHLAGVKRWTLFPPSDAPCLYTEDPEHGEDGFAISAVDLGAPDLARHPRFADARPLQVDIHPGEVLYLPTGWHHHVENLEPAVMVNYWLIDTRVSPGLLTTGLQGDGALSPRYRLRALVDADDRRRARTGQASVPGAEGALGLARAALAGGRTGPRFVPPTSRRPGSAASPWATCKRRDLQGVLSLTYRGLLLGKTPVDLSLYTRLIWELQPRTIVELGALHGASGLWFADQMTTLCEEPGEVHSFERFPELIDPSARHPRLHFHEADLAQPETLDASLLGRLPHPWLVVDDAHVAVVRVMLHLDRFMAPGDGYVIEDVPISHSGEFHAALPAIEAAGYAIDTDYADGFGVNVTSAPNAWFRKMRSANARESR